MAGLPIPCGESVYTSLPPKPVDRNLINAQRPFDHLLDGVLSEDALSGCFAESTAKVFVPQDPEHHLPEGTNVAGWNQQPARARLANHFGDSAHSRRNHRSRARHRLQQNDRECFVTLRREEKTIGCGEVSSDGLMRLRPDERDAMPRLRACGTAARVAPARGHPRRSPAWRRAPRRPTTPEHAPHGDSPCPASDARHTRTAGKRQGLALLGRPWPTGGRRGSRRFHLEPRAHVRV